jgi:hypothetical protein
LPKVKTIHNMNPIITEIETEVARMTAVVPSAIALIEGISARVQAGIDAALAAGATEAQLATLTDEVAALQSGSTALAAAVAANTPGGPTTPVPEQGLRNRASSEGVTVKGSAQKQPPKPTQ